MTEKKQAPAEGQQGAKNLSKDTHIVVDTQLLGQVEVTIPDNSKLDTTPILPTWGIPHLTEGINHIADVFRCSTDYVLMAQMMAISTAIGKKIKSYDGKYYNYGMMWSMLVGRQGTCKSEPLKQALQPLFDINSELYQEYKRQKEVWTEGMPVPVYTPTIVGDTTPEYLYELMGRGGAVTCYYDEIANLEENKGRYNQNGDASLAIFSGSQLSVNRKNGEPILITDPFMNITGTIQPETLTKIYGKDMYINNGYLSRWLYVYPENQAIQMYNQNVVDENIMRGYNNFIRNIATTSIQPYTMTYTAEAKKLYADYFNLLQTKKMNATDGYEAGIYSKLQIHVQRWALVTYIARVFEPSLNEGMKITGEIMQYSIDCMGYFEHTAMKVHDMIVRNRNLRNQPRVIGKEGVIRKLVEYYPNAGDNKQLLADCLAVSRAFISKTLSKGKTN